MVKKITTDEFMYGRRKKNGERIDQGTGLSKPSVIEGLNNAVKHGLLEVEIDDSDKARIKKFYKLRMKTPMEEAEPKENAAHADVKKLYTGVKNVNSSSKKSLQRSEKYTLERYINVRKQNKKDTNETKYYAGLLADKLGDHKSLTYYKIACQRIDPHILMQKAAEIVADGGARNPGAVFAEWVKTRQKHVDMHYSALLHPIIEQAIAKEMRSYSSRIAMLLVRVAFDSG